MASSLQAPALMISSDVQSNNKSRRASLTLFPLLLLVGSVGCGEGSLVQDGMGAGEEPIGTEQIVAADPASEEVGAIENALTGSLPVGTLLKTTTSLNLRTGPSTAYRILLTMPTGASVTVVAADPRNGFYNVKYGTTTGWASGNYLVKPTTTSTTTTTTVTISGPAVLSHVRAFANAACTAVGCPYTVGTYEGHDPTASRALDFMQSTGGKLPSDGGARGDKLAAFALANFTKYRLMYVIWEQKINSNDGRGWRQMSDRGSITQNHYDHVHVSFNP